jgi:hypothetical protein
MVDSDFSGEEISLMNTRRHVLTERKTRLVLTSVPLFNVSFDLDDSSTISNSNAMEPTRALNEGPEENLSFSLTQMA